jgi:hypothetical protein
MPESTLDPITIPSSAQFCALWTLKVNNGGLLVCLEDEMEILEIFRAGRKCAAPFMLCFKNIAECY